MEFLPKPICLSVPCLCLALAASVLSPAELRAEDGTTVPAGCLNYTFAGGSLTSAKITTFSVPLRKVTGTVSWTTAGKITGITALTLTCSGANWPVNGLAAVGSPYWVKIKNGTAQGNTFLISSNTATTLTLPTGTDLTALGLSTSGPSQSTFEIFPGDTLLSLFGPGNSTGAGGTILGGSSVNNSDNISVHDGVGWKYYWFSISANRWQESTADRNNLVLVPTWGMRYFRRAANPIALTLPGTVTDTPTVLTVSNTTLTFFNTLFPVDTTLLNTGIHLKPGFVANTGTLALADKVLIWNGTAWSSYSYYQPTGEWRLGSGTVSQNAFNIPAGTPIWFQKTTATTSSEIWNFPLPYTL